MRTKVESAGDGPRVAIYTRVSSDEQVKEHYSLDTQRDRCLGKLDSVYGENLYVPHFYADEGLPGRYGLYDEHSPRKRYRPGLTKMQQDFKDGKLDVICVYRMNRLWRKAASGDFIIDHFVPHGLKRVISCTENIDIETASGRFQLNVSAAVGAYEAEQLGEWVSDALQKRKREGYTLGIPYGWRQQTPAEIEPGQRPGIARVDEQADVIAEVAARYLRGESLRNIAKGLTATAVKTPRRAKKWHMSAVKRILANPTHAGLVDTSADDGEAEYSEGKHFAQRVYDPETFYQIRERMQRRAERGARATSDPVYLLGGTLTCSHCGSLLNGRYSKRLRRRLYRCSTGSQLNNSECVRNSERADLVEMAVMEELKSLASDHSARAAAASRLNELSKLEAQSAADECADLEKRLEELWEEYDFWSEEWRRKRCNDDEYGRHCERIRSARAEVEARLEHAKELVDSDQQRQAVLSRATEIIADIDQAIEGLPMADRRELLQAVVERATMGRIADGRTEVRFALRGFGEFTTHIGRRHQANRPDEGLDALTPTEQATLYLYAQGLDRDAIARKRGVKWACVNSQLWQARKKLGVETPEEAWETAREFIEENLHWLPLTGRKRRARDTTPAPDRPLLTEAQAQVLAALRQGLSPTEAARKLGRSPNTVYVQLKDCRERLGVGSTEDAVAKALDLGYVQ